MKFIRLFVYHIQNLNIRQQINFVENLEKDDGATIFFIAEEQQKTILNFSLDSLIVTD